MVEQFYYTLPEEQMLRRGFHFLLAAAERVCFVRAEQELLGHSDVSTTMI
jgi:site-specific recombinase XerC